MTWTSRDFKIDNDGRIKELDSMPFTDEAVGHWRTLFAADKHQVWEIILDTPNLIVMVVPPSGDGEREIRFSFNTPDE